MASIEELIYKRLLESDLKEKLAQYGHRPAVFFQTAPDDTAKEWKCQQQYPRIEFDIDLHANPERQTSGVLSVHVVCEESGIAPEEVVPLISVALCDVFFVPDKYNAISLAWVRTENFEMTQKERARLLIGASIVFDIYEFPVQETSDPDPVAAMNAYAKQFDKSIVVIGSDEIVDFYKPTHKQPAAYFRVVESFIELQTNTVVWMNAAIAVHFFAPDLSVRGVWIKAFTDQLALAGEVTMLDGSPMFLLNSKNNAAYDEQTGQLRLTVKYGILRRPQYAHALTRMSTMKGTIKMAKGVSKVTTPVNNALAIEEIYTVEELADAASTGKLLDKKISRAMVFAAFKIMGKDKATKAEAVRIISDFRKKKVK